MTALSEYEQPLSNHERDGGRVTHHERRGHADIRSNMDTVPLSEYEQTLSNHEHDAGRVMNVTEEAAQVH